MSDNWLEVINQGTDPGQADNFQCDGCVGILGAADDEQCDHRCSLCKRPLSGASLWIETHRDDLTEAHLGAVQRALIPERNKDYRVHYYSDAMEQGLKTGLMTKAQATFLAGTVRGTIVREGE